MSYGQEEDIPFPQQWGGTGANEAQSAMQEELDKERIQLEKQRKIYEENMQTIQSQINELSSILNSLKNNNVDQDKIEDVEEQLEELYDDKAKLEETGFDLSERESIFEEKWNKFASTNDIAVTSSESSPLPDWFKSNAKWWKQGLISDGDIINALESLIIQNVIPLDNFVKESSGLEHTAGVSSGGTFVMVDEKPTIPTYQKDVFGFWSDGLVSDDEIVNSIGHLMSEGIINSAKIQAEITEKRSLLTNSQDSTKQEYSETIDEDGIITEKYPDGTKKMIFPDGSVTEFYTDGSRTTFFPNPTEYEDSNKVSAPVLGGLWDGLPAAEREFKVTKVHTDSEGWRTFYEADTVMGLISPNGERALFDYSIKKYEETDEWEDPSSGEMQQLIQVTAMTIDGIQYPISQFTIWKWTGECDDAWHYHTPFGQAVSIDGETGIVDPDQDNCGFGKVGEVFIGLAFMTQEQINKFRDKTDSDPLTNEPMTGGSDDGASPVEVNPGPATIEESDKNTISTKTTSPYGMNFVDSDGDGISDEIDDEPNKKSKKFGTNGSGLPGKIIDAGDLTISIIGTDDFGTLVIEVGTDGDSESVIINVMGVDIEYSAGSIVEISFG